MSTHEGLKEKLFNTANAANSERVDALIESMKANAANGEYSIKIDGSNKDLAYFMKIRYGLQMDADPFSAGIIVLSWHNAESF